MSWRCSDVDMPRLTPENPKLRQAATLQDTLRPFFGPKAVALIGASRAPESLGSRVLRSLTIGGFQGSIFPINPNATQVGEWRAYASLRELQDRPDLAIICVPRHAALNVVDQCATAGVRAVVVVTAGFAETDAEGRELEQRLRQKISGHGMRMIGPNCVGLINTDPAVRLNTTFSQIHPLRGRVAMGSQSGAIGLAVMAAARRLGVGFSSFVSLGNEADVSCADLVEYWGEDDDTDVILLYLESFTHGRRLCEVSETVSRTKPIVVLQAGRSRGGRRAAGSHTAALASSETMVAALFRRGGWVRAETLEDLMDLAATFSQQPLPSGGRVGIVTNAGGPAVLCTDACERTCSQAYAAGKPELVDTPHASMPPGSALVVPELSAEASGALRQFIPFPASVANPIDMTAAAGPAEYRRATETLLASSEVDALIVIYIPVEMFPNREFIVAISDGVLRVRAEGGRDPPIVACVFSQEGRQPPLIAGSETIPCFSDPEAAARALRKSSEYAAWRRTPQGTIPVIPDCRGALARNLCDRAVVEHGAGWLPVAETRAVLEAGGLPFVTTEFVRTPDQAIEAANRLGFPVVLKAVSPSIIHKHERGLVRLSITDADGVRAAFQRIETSLQQLGDFHPVTPESTSRDCTAVDVLVQPMLSGVELFAGAVRDRAIGPVLGFGLGGVTVELLNDVCWRLAPLRDRDAAEMVREFRCAPLLNGHRGRPAVDIGSLQQILLRLSHLMECVPRICQVDFNPVLALPAGKGSVIVDARIEVQ